MTEQEQQCIALLERKPPRISLETTMSDAPAETNGTSAPATKAPRKSGPKIPKASTSELGQTFLPASRVTKIIKADKDIAMCSKEAVFLISVAAEHFVKKLTEAAYVTSKAEKRKGIQYKDLATAIQRNQSFFYLSVARDSAEVIPPPVPVKEAIKARKRKIAEETGQLDDFDPTSTSAGTSSFPQPAPIPLPSLNPTSTPTPAATAETETTHGSASASRSLSLKALLNAADEASQAEQTQQPSSNGVPTSQISEDVQMGH